MAGAYLSSLLWKQTVGTSIPLGLSGGAWKRKAGPCSLGTCDTAYTVLPGLAGSVVPQYRQTRGAATGTFAAPLLRLRSARKRVGRGCPSMT